MVGRTRTRPGRWPGGPPPLSRFQRTVELGDEVGGREVDAAVGVSRRGRPSPRSPPTCRRAATGGENRRVFAGGSQYARPSGEPEPPQRLESGRSCGGSTPCFTRGPRAASSSARPCSAACRGLETCALVAAGSEVPVRQPGVAVSRPDEAVEVEFKGCREIAPWLRHDRRRPPIWSVSISF